ncbi:trypsin-like peptidase domain-containing protein [Streptomyces sp. NPDC096095]|uniref:trypsin-like peptidase domain-containing protein n=1 Tax=Streptomyces sp. NPDC096095 TaxID=3155545 RepID=UPI00332977DF
MTAEGPERARVAELIVVHAGGRRRGSGYRVTDRGVLTAAHVLRDAVSVQVRFEPHLPGEWSTPAETWCADQRSDVAVVSIRPRAAEEPLAPAPFGRIEGRAAVLPVQAVGFPLWKLRTDEHDGPAANGPQTRYRDSHHAVGTVAVLSNWREGTLEVTVPPEPAAQPRSTESPWQGMSGAAVWAGGRIVGVLHEHHPADGLARLAAARIDRALALLDAAERARIRALLPIPERAGELPDVVPSSRAALTASAYQAQLADIAPEQLLDREWELAELAQFCAGEQRYAWLQAGPWAGKSALLSWFALHPPAGVAMVSFFVTSRWAGQSDSEAFTEAVIEQLAALVGESPQPALESRAAPGHLLRLLQLAAQHCVADGRQLLLVVDGLDEDRSGAAGADQPSIASLLPHEVPRGVQVLVASRPSPGLPDDVPADHPLHHAEPLSLKDSPHARDKERLAKSELARALRGPEHQRDVLGLIAASGGGLTRHDLEELTARPPFELEELLNGPLGRTVGSRAVFVPVGGLVGRAHVFAHETLGVLAEEQFGNQLADYRRRLHIWADDYRERGWPSDMPVYLLRGYSRLLAATNDLPRLFACAVDRARHGRLLERTGSDASVC